jgi:hypothetical protein
VAHEPIGGTEIADLSDGHHLQHMDEALVPDVGQLVVG